MVSSPRGLEGFGECVGDGLLFVRTDGVFACTQRLFDEFGGEFANIGCGEGPLLAFE